jgi:hypothetical protein
MNWNKDYTLVYDLHNLRLLTLLNLDSSLL